MQRVSRVIESSIAIVRATSRVPKWVSCCIIAATVLDERFSAKLSIFHTKYCHLVEYPSSKVPLILKDLGTVLTRTSSKSLQATYKIASKTASKIFTKILTKVLSKKPN